MCFNHYLCPIIIVEIMGFFCTNQDSQWDKNGNNSTMNSSKCMSEYTIAFNGIFLGLGTHIIDIFLPIMYCNHVSI